jgi:transposase
MAPLVRRSWAPRGQTPTLAQQTRSHRKVSVITAVTLAPQRSRVGLYFALHPDANLDAERIVQFLRRLRRHLQRPIVIVWDRLRAHRGRVVQRFLQRSRQIHVELLPPYAPELNPSELVWSYLKRNPLANYAPTDTNELHATARHHLRRLRRRYGLLRSFLYATPLFSSPKIGH